MNHPSSFIPLPFRGLALILALLVPLGTAPVSLQAATYTWTQTTTGSQDWNTTGNWTTGTPFASSSSNELAFLTSLQPAAGAAITVTNVPTTLSMNVLTLAGTGPNSTLGSSITIGTSASKWTIGDGTTSTVNLNSGLGGGSADRDIRYTIAANLELNGGTSGITTFTGNSASVTGAVFSGNITETGSNKGITKSGSSLLIFSGSNSYTGKTTVSAGTLRLNSANALSGGLGATGGTSALTIDGTGVVELGAGNFQRNLGAGSSQFQITSTGSNAVGFSAIGGPRVITVNNDASQELQWGSATFAPAKLLLNAASANNSLELANKIDLNAATRTVVVNADKALLSGVIRGAAGLTKEGNGTLVLTGSSTYNNTTTLTGGALSIGAANNIGIGNTLNMNGGTLQVTGTALTSISGIGHTVTLSGATAKAFDIHNAANTFTVDQAVSGTTFGKGGVGTLVLNQNNSLTGATSAGGGGTLVLDYGSGQNNSKLANAALNLSGGSLVLRGGSHAQAVTSIVLAGATGNSISRDGSAATIANAGVLTVGGLSNLNIAEAGIVSTTSANVNGIQTNGQVTVGSNFATKDAGNLLQAYSIPGGNQYTAGGGGSNITTVNQLAGGGNMTGTLNSYALRIVNSGSSDILNLGAHSLNMANGGTVLYAGGSDNNYTINGTSGQVKTNNGNQPLNINIFTGTLTVNANLGVSGSGSFAKAGAGTLVLGGSNTSGVATYIQQGVLRLANASGLGTTAGGTIVQGGAALELSSGITVVGAEALSLNGAGIFDGSVFGGALRNHSGSNKYEGLITIGASGARINSNVSTSLELKGGIATTLTQDVTFGGLGNTTVSTAAISGSGKLIKDGGGSLTLSATNTYTGSTTISVGTINANKSSALGNEANANNTLIFNGGTLQAGGAITSASTRGVSLLSTGIIDTNGNAVSIAGIISGTGGLTKIGSNILTLTGTNTYSGATTINVGTLNANATAALGDETSVNNTLVFTGGTLQAGGNIVSAVTRGVTMTSTGIIDTNGNAVSIAGIIGGTGGLTKSGGTGTLTLTGSNTYGGATAVNVGTLFINGNQTSAAGAITVASGATLGGAGTIGGATTIQSGGFYSPGNSPGTLSHSDSLILDAGSIFNWENSTANTLGSGGTDWDVTNITSGTLTLSNTPTTGSQLRLQFTNASTSFSDPFWNSNQTWDFITGGVSGSNAFDATNISIWINGVQQGSNNTISGQGTFTTIVSGSNERLVWTAAAGGIPTAYWAGATDGDWATLTNWRDAASGGAVIGTAPDSTTDVHFSTTSPVPGNLGAVNLGANFTVKTLAFDASSTAVTIGSSGGFVLTITPTSSANGINVDTTAGDSTLSVKVELGAAQTWTVGTNRTLTASGVVSGSFGLTKAGAGNLTLTNTNTYTGATNINGGVVKINDLRNIGDNGATNSVGIDGGTLESTGNTYALGTNRSVALGAGGGTIKTSAGALTVDGAVDTNGNLLTVSGAANTTISGLISEGGGLTKNDAGTLTLSATNTYTGTTTLNAGTINLGAAENAGVSGPLGNQAADAAGTIVMGGGTLQYSASNNFDYSGRFSTAASQAYNVDTNGQNVIWATALTSSGGTLTKLGAGTLSLNGTNSNTYNGVTTVSGGTLDLNKTGGATAIAGDLLINGGTVKLLQNEQIANTASITQTSGAFNLNGRTETIVSYTKTGGSFTTGRGGSLIGTGATITYDGPGGPNRIDADSTVSDGHVILTNGATLDLAGANAPFVGLVGTNGGILDISSGGDGLEMNGSAGNTINLASDTNSTTAARIVLDDDVTTGGTGLNTIASTGVGATKGYVALGAAGSRTFTVADTVSGTGTDLDISAVISSTGAGLTKAGDGTLAMSAVNSYTGATSVNAGILQVGVGGVGSTHASSNVTATSATFTTATTGAGVNANNVAVSGQTVITVGPVVAGSGTIFGDLTVGTNSSNVGVIRPGDLSGSSNGTLTIGGNLVVNNGSQLQMGLASTTQNDANFNWYVPTGGQSALAYLTGVVTLTDYQNEWDSADGGYDSINVTGTLSLGTGGAGYPTHIVSVNPSYTPVLGDIFKLLNWSGIGHQDPDAIGGTHSLPGDMVLPSLGAGYTWDTTAYNAFGVVVVIPEPGRMMLLFFGLAALFLRRRRSR